MLIYKITSPNSDIVYVGRTTKTLGQRFTSHLWNYKRHLAGEPRCYYSSFKVLECGDSSIELIEETEDASREVHWIRELEACNIMKYDHDELACKKVRYYENRDVLLAKMSAYRAVEANREAIHKQQNEKTVCDNCGRVVNRSYMKKHKKTKICQNTASTE